MKIVIPVAAPFGKQGGWRVISELPTFWINQGHEVFFLTPDGNLPYFPTKAQFLYYDNLGNIVDQAKAKQRKKPLLGPIQLRYALEKAINKISADILLATHSFTAGPIERSKIKAKKFYYVQAYEAEMYKNGPFWYKVYEEIARRSYSKEIDIIVNSEMYLNYREIKSDKVVFPGMDLDNFKSALKKIDSGEVYVMGTIGRTEEYKGTIYIINAFKELRKIYKDKIELHIAFGDDELSEIEGVKIIVPQGDKELASYYQSLDVYVCAGTIQLKAIHYPVIESMACNTPVITTGYFPANDSNAWIVPIKNSEAIKDSVIHLINNPLEAKLKLALAEKDVNQFSWDKVSSKMLNYFINGLNDLK